MVFYVNALTDNYIWCILNYPNLWIVDPGRAEPILDFLKEKNDVHFQGIWVTHHHMDHTAGIAKLKKNYPKIKVFAPEKGKIKGTTNPLKGGELLDCGDFKMEVIASSGHTLDHLIYKMGDSLFVGDVLFGAGCGRLFEGTPEEMFCVLQKIAAMPDSTKIYCAHEYTVQNLKFAQKVETQNVDIQKRLQMLARNPVSVPFSLKIEKATNPFLRVNQKSVRDFVGLTEEASALEVFARLRTLRDVFKG